MFNDIGVSYNAFENQFINHFCSSIALQIIFYLFNNNYNILNVKKFIVYICCILKNNVHNFK